MKSRKQFNLNIMSFKKDFHIIITNCKPRLNIIDVDNSCKRKIFLMNISIVFLVNVLLFFIVHNI